ncbi:MAG: radical SAM protein [Spirochaetes bacterium]|nr:radical SAM protein [Spirochaetota bacterium]
MNQNASIIPKMFMSNPDKALYLADGFLAQMRAKEIDYHDPEGVSNELALITFKITPKCNLRCVMCGQRGIHGTLKDEMAVREEQTLVSIEQYKRLTDEVKDKTKVFYIWGGEPMLYPNFLDLAEYMAKNIPIFTINTNGTLLAPHAERIVHDQWTGFFISLDGFRETNDAIRGEGSYQKVIDSITAINAEKKKRKSVLPHVGIVTTVCNKNYLYLDKLVEATRDIGLSWHIINLGTYLNEKIGQDHVQYMKEHLDYDPRFWKGFTSGFNEGIDGDRFSEILDRAHRIQTDHPLITVPVIDPKCIGTYYSELETTVRDQCLAPWFSVDINYNGDAHFCADYPDYVIGNIKNETMTDIYNGAKARRFRQELANAPDGIFPACKRCYQLMLCGRRRKGY